jgi:two-component system, chemotaxis family, protein-glutamate methylesterase/glutaminase
MIVAIGCSQGGVEALTSLVKNFDPMWHASILITLHIGRSESHLPEILQRHCRLQVKHALHETKIERNHVYIAPPDFHLCTKGPCLRLSHGPTENWTRPAIDPMFRSAAENHGKNTIGILLTGRLADGVSGLVDIKGAGGQTIVQSPQDAMAPDLPENALKLMTPDFICPLRTIPTAIERCLEARR